MRMKKLRPAVYLTAAGVAILLIAFLNYDQFTVNYWSPPTKTKTWIIPETNIRVVDSLSDDDKLHGWSYQYYPDGTLQYQSLHVNGQWAGKTSYFKTNGELYIDITDFYLFRRTIRRQPDGTYKTSYSWF